MTNKATKIAREPGRKVLRPGPRHVAMPLSDMRIAMGKTQTEISHELEINQANISRLEALENLDDCQVATLRRYIEAVGGKLELTAVFPMGHRIEILPADKS